VDSFKAVSVSEDRWFGCNQPNPQASLRLFCFPYAGAGSSMFHPWAQWLSPNIELNLIHFPGRDKRIREPLHTDLSSLVEEIGEAILSRLDRPFAFFGHSLGALVSFEVARYLNKKHDRLAKHLFLSARRAPHLQDPYSNIYLLPEKDFLKTAEELYGKLPDIVKEDRDILQLFLNIMRADLTMTGRYQYYHEPPLQCPLTVFGGVQDASVTEHELNAWQEHTTAKFELFMFPGDHFYIHGSRMLLLQNLNRTLSSV
jgi:medium-chain acyl-[acyl-carrier-protein] hydrolase